MCTALAAAAPPPPPARSDARPSISPPHSRATHAASSRPSSGPGSERHPCWRNSPMRSCFYRACAGIMAWSFRRELRDMLHSCDATACAWTVPGSVWAADVWKPVQPIEDIYPYVLDVRDLATGYMVESCALLHADAETVGGHLWRLYDIRSPPLVLKTDNGPEFVGDGAWQVSRVTSASSSCARRPRCPVTTAPARRATWRHALPRRTLGATRRHAGTRAPESPRGRAHLDQRPRPSGDTGSCPSRQFDSRAPLQPGAPPAAIPGCGR